MKITYNRSGGFGNIPVSVEIITTDQDATTQETLNGLVSKVLTAKPSTVIADGAADYCTHRFLFDGKQKVEFTDLNMPDEVADLIEMLLKVAGK